MDTAQRQERTGLRFETAFSFWLIRHRWWLLALAVLLAALAFRPAQRLKMDRGIEKMFAPDDPLLVPLFRLQRIFGGNEIVLCVYDDPQLLDPSEVGTKRMENIRKELAAVPGVKGVLSLDMPIGTHIVDDHYVSEQLRQLFQGYTHGADGRTSCVACMLEPRATSSVSRKATIRQLRNIMRHLPDGLPPGTCAGEPVMMEDAYRFIEQDGRRLMITTTILLGLVILACFRSWRWVMIPILVVQLSLLLTRGILGASGIQLTLVSSMLTAVVTVVGVATVVHIIVRYREGLSAGMAPQRSLANTLSRLAAPVFWACVTDAAGFGALLAASVSPIREFGTMMAIGSLMVLVSCALIIPALTLLGKTETHVPLPARDRFLNRRLLGLIALVERYPGWVSAVTFVGSLVACLGASRLIIETDFTRNFRESTEIVRSYELVESKLGGAGVFDIVIPAPKELTWPFMVQVLRLEDELRDEVQVCNEAGQTELGLTKVVSLADVIDQASATDLREVRRTRFRQRLINAGLKAIRERIAEFYAALYAPDPDDPENYCYRIMLRARERQPAHQKQEIIQQVNAITSRTYPDAEISGYFILLTNLIDSILRDQWRTFAVALGAIFLIMLVAVRSVPLALIGVIPNVVPILVVNGMMGWLGLKINMGAAMIAAVSMGLSIDGSIHYLIAFQRARREGLNRRESLVSVQQSVGRAIVFSAVALIVGFFALATSDFIPTIYFGTLVSISMLFTMVGTLLWLPLLIQLVIPDRKRATTTLSSSAKVTSVQ